MPQTFLTLMPLLAALFMSSCTEDEIFETLGQQVAGPIDITQSSTHFFVLNADIDRKYNAGSILVLDTNGNRVSATETPRLGRFLTLSGTTLIAGFGPTDQYQTQPQIQFYNVSNPANPVLEHTISMDCSPVNAVAPEGYNYFAVSCVSVEDLHRPVGKPSIINTALSCKAARWKHKKSASYRHSTQHALRIYNRLG